MAYSTLTWEISTGDPARHVQIADAVDRALRAFAPCALLSNTVMFDRSRDRIDGIRDAFDTIAASFPAEFFYHSTDHGMNDILQGDYPPWADLATAQQMTGSNNTPFDRSPQPILSAGGPSPREGSLPRGRRGKRRAAGRGSAKAKRRRPR